MKKIMIILLLCIIATQGSRDERSLATNLKSLTNSLFSSPAQSSRSQSDFAQQLYQAMSNIFGQFFKTLKVRAFGTPPVEAFMSTPQLIKHYGYPVEKHQVTTVDGYTLTMYRIPGKLNEDGRRNRPVVLQHGLVCTSDAWLFLAAEDSLPFLLSNEDHDVWLTNFRGNKYAQKHDRLRSANVKFWDFSIDEIGKYDVPAIITYVSTVTEWEKLNWVGHSMGCAALFLAIDQNPNLNLVIHKMFAMAPAVYVQHLVSPILKIFSYIPQPTLLQIGNLLGQGRFIPSQIQDWVLRSSPYFCAGKSNVDWCRLFFTLLGGDNPDQFTRRTVSIAFGNIPAASSMKTVGHYAQFIHRAKFEGYDYGPQENLKRYNSTQPQVYDLSKVTIPVVVSYGLNDWLVGPKDAQRTIKELANVQEHFAVNNSNFNHFDFLCAKDSRALVYDKVINFLSS